MVLLLNHNTQNLQCDTYSCICYSCIAVTNCSTERSFLCLKRTITYLRSTIGENWLNSLALLCIESELVSTIDFQYLIDTFANLKSRTKMI
jgi:hypothetical protein